MNRWANRTAIVTGASAGIGESIVRSLVGAGVHVVGLARRLDRLREISESLEASRGKFYPIRCDLRNEPDILEAFQWTNAELGGVDILVNNAGVLFVKSIADSETEEFRNILDVNVLSVAICTREAIESMRARNSDGHLVFVSSVLGYKPTLASLPTSLYPASKFAIRGMIENIKREVERSKDRIGVTNIIPGLVRTDLFEIGGGEDSIYDRLPYVHPRDIAEGVTFALSAPPNVQVEEMTITPLDRKA